MSLKSKWQEAALPQYPQLNHDLSCDVLVIGGGITGLTTAYLLLRAGLKVCLIERDRIAQGDTCRTTAHLTAVTDIRLTELVKTCGEDGAKLIWQGGMAAINTIEKIVKSEGLNCHFRRIPGYLHASLQSDRDESDALKKEQQLARQLGIEAVYLDRIPEVGKPGVRFANQAKFQPLSYLAGLAKVFHNDGGFLFEKTEASEFKEQPRVVVANGRNIRCKSVVIATHVPLMGDTGMISATLFQAKLVSYSSYVIGALIPKGSFPEASYWDTSHPYHYLRIDSEGATDYAIFGGQDHKTGQDDNPNARYQALTATLLKLIPDARVDRQWTGQVVETHDGLPYIGETAEHQFIATGFAGNGMTFGTLAAMMACDYVQQRQNPWQDLLSPERKGLSGTWDLIKQTFDYPYYLVHDLFSAADDSPESLAPGMGKILNIDGKRVACARDDKGQIHAVSAVCTHMGCIVHWNNAGNSWDCPCHGSRFKVSGEVLAGPAETNLEPVQLDPIRTAD